MDETASGLWHVSDGGLTKGPYTETMLQQRVNHGQISASALVWKDGMAAWQPLPLHFNLAVRGPAPHPAHQAVPPDRTLLRWLALVAALAALVGNYGGLIDADAFSPLVYVALRLALFAILCAAGVTTMLLWWRAAKIAECAGSRRGWWKVLVVIGGIAVAASLVVTLSALPFAYRLQAARASFRDFTLTTDTASGTIRMRGVIGPGFARQLAAQLKAAPGIKVIEIDSIGGLVDEALAASHDIQRRGGLTVVARKACNSACLIVFMSGEKRVAPLDLVFGFHATAPITTVKGVYRLEELAKNGEAADHYLISRGVPAVFVKGARNLGPSKMYQVSAIRMMEVGAVTQLLDGGNPVSPAEGKWLAVIRELQRAHLTKEEMDFFLLIDRVAPTTAQDFAAKALELSDKNDTDGIVALVRGLVATMTGRALPAAGDAALMQSAVVLATELRYVQAKERWDVCTGLLAGKGFGDLTLPDELMAMDFRASAGLVQSAAQNAWVKQSLPSQAESEGIALGKATAVQMARDGQDARQFGKDPKITCAWTANLMSGISEKPAPEAARIYRWLLAQQ